MKKTIKIMSVILAMLLMLAIPVVAAEEGATPKKYEATTNYEDIVWSDDNPDTLPYGAWKAGSNTVYVLTDILPADKIVRTEGFSGGDYDYYTDSTTNNANGAAINGPYKKSGQGFTCGGNIRFDKGFGTHPKSNQTEVYINIDISKYTDANGEYKCDTFYSCVGLTNSASPGVYFQVFADYGDGEFKHIANSSDIIMTNIGEFNVDITGVKILRLVVITSTMANSSSASAWLNPSIFKADAAAVKPSYKVEDTTPEDTEPENTTGGSIGGEDEQTTPTTNAPEATDNTPEGSESTSSEEEGGCGSTIGFAAASVVALAAGVVVATKRKKED